MYCIMMLYTFFFYIYTPVYDIFYGATVRIRAAKFIMILHTMICAITPSKRIVSFTKLTVTFLNRTVQYKKCSVPLQKKTLP